MSLSTKKKSNLNMLCANTGKNHAGKNHAHKHFFHLSHENDILQNSRTLN